MNRHFIVSLFTFVHRFNRCPPWFVVLEADVAVEQPLCSKINANVTLSLSK